MTTKQSFKSILIHFGLIITAAILFAASFPNPLFKNGLPFLAWFAYIPVLIVIRRNNLISCVGWGAIYGFTVTIFLQACCGPCASVAVERLLGDGHGLALFFCNPNLSSHEEWARRLEGVVKVGAHFGVVVEVEPWDGTEWMRNVGQASRPVEELMKVPEPEGGARCAQCFEWRLRKTWERARESGFEAFTTSLTTGPRKNSQLIFELGRKVGGAAFVAEDFKKRGGFQRSVELARELGLYRQNFCGCYFSAPTPVLTGHGFSNPCIFDNHGLENPCPVAATSRTG